MSLILTARYNSGILLAADSFVFDNHGESPQKVMSFFKILVSKRHGIAMTAVGSRWVFFEAYDWLKKQRKNKADLLTHLTEKWRELNYEWKAEREWLAEESVSATLRPLSDSVLVIARQTELDTIRIIDPTGKMHETKSFVASGSGQDLVQQYLQAKEKAFKPTDTLRESLNLMQECFQYASRDLYVTGFPAIAVVNEEGITDISAECGQYWQGAMKRYYGQVNKALQRSLEDV